MNNIVKKDYKSIILGISIILILLVSATYAYFSITNSTDSSLSVELGIAEEGIVTLTSGTDTLNIVVDSNDMSEANTGTTYYFTKVADLTNVNRTTTKTSSNIATLATATLTSGAIDNVYRCTTDITVSSSGTMKDNLSLGDAIYYLDNTYPISIINNAFDLSRATTREVEFYIKRTSNTTDTLDFNGYATLTNTNSDQTLMQDKSLSISVTMDNLSCKIVSDMGIPKEYQEVEYLESTGTQYIDTEYVMTSNKEKAYVDYMKTDVSSYVSIYGSEYPVNANSSTRIFSLILHGKASSAIYIGTGGNSNVENLLDTRYQSTLTADNGSLYGTHLNTSTNTTSYINSTYQVTNGNLVDNPHSIFLFGNHTASGYQLAKTRIYRFKLWDNDTLVRDMIPCYRKSDNVFGMYDVVFGKFYQNKGSGVFKIGNVVEDDLLLYYDGINNSSDGHSTTTTTWLDKSGNNNDGTLSSFENTETSGWGTNGLAFDGSDDAVMSSSSGTNFSNYKSGVKFSFGATFNTGPTTLNSLEGILSNMPSWGAGGFNIQIGSTQGIALGMGRYINAGITPTANQNYNVFGVYDGTIIKIYVNGILKNSQTYSIKSGAENIQLSRFYYNSSLPTHATIYSVYFFSKALSDREVDEIYQSDFTRYNLS